MADCTFLINASSGYWSTIFFPLDFSLPSSSSSSGCSAQGQVLHCRRKNQGGCSAEGNYSTTNSGTKVADLPKRQVFTANSGTKVAVLPKGRSSPANLGTKVAVLPKGRFSTVNSGTKVAVLHKGRFSTANPETKVAVLLKGRFSTANSGTQAAVLLGMDRCGSFPLLSTPHSLFSILTDLQRSEMIHSDTMVEVRSVCLANWALRTSPKFTTGVKYQFQQDF